MGPTTRSRKISVRETKETDPKVKGSEFEILEGNNSKRKLNSNLTVNLNLESPTKKKQKKGKEKTPENDLDNSTETATQDEETINKTVTEDEVTVSLGKGTNISPKTNPGKISLMKNKLPQQANVLAEETSIISSDPLLKIETQLTVQDELPTTVEEKVTDSVSVTQGIVAETKEMTLPAESPQIAEPNKIISNVISESNIENNEDDLIADEEPRMACNMQPKVDTQSYEEQGDCDNKMDISDNCQVVDEVPISQMQSFENDHIDSKVAGMHVTTIEAREEEVLTISSGEEEEKNPPEPLTEVLNEPDLQVEKGCNVSVNQEPHKENSLVQKEKYVELSVAGKPQKVICEKLAYKALGRINVKKLNLNEKKKPKLDQVSKAIPSSDKGNQSKTTENLNEEKKSDVDLKEIASSYQSKTIEKEKKKEEPKVEFISVYSSEQSKKRPLEPNRLPVHKEPDQSQPRVQIGPLQPVLQLVDPATLDKETENYYKEVGAIRKPPQPSKPKCLTPRQIAQITKDYPQVNPGKDKGEDSEKVQTAWTLLHQYWTFVQENPYDFDGWTYLLNHVETMDNIEAARSAFEGFLPLYPYCFAYWMKLSDLELKFSDLEKALGVLYLGTKCVPFCTDLWVPLLNKFLEYATKENISEEVIRGLYEFSLDSLGLSWQSSSIWDVCINYELTKGDLVRVMNLYRRILSIPTKLYNKHWDHLLALVRDYHPRNLLTIEEYSILKKSACDLLKIKFNPPSLEAPTSLLKVTQPEDKIHTTIKEKIVASLIPVHEANEKECNRRWKYEEKIKRPYFHVKPLEKKQLKTWREYLDFEIKNGDPVRIVTLFERCLVPCAMYEEFWCKYASFMEDHVLNVMKQKYANVEYKPGCFSQKNSEENGDKDKTSMVNGEKTSKQDDKKSDEKEEKKNDKSQPSDSAESVELSPDFWQSGSKKLEVSPEVKFEVTFLLNRLSEDIGVGTRALAPPSLTPSSILRGLTWEDVRQIYRRGAWIHCPNKPLILMQWAEFEEAQESIQTARELLNTVLVKHPKLLKARIQLIELERRSNQLDRVEELYAQTFATFNETRIRSYIAIRYARFLFKIREEDDKALLILRKALKKDKGNMHLYHHVFDVCYQRRPIDCNGVLASVMLALASKELSTEEKHWFCIKRSEFLREHGTMRQLKEAKAEMEEFKLKLEKEKAMQATKNGEEENKDEAKQVTPATANANKANENSNKQTPNEGAPKQTQATDSDVQIVNPVPVNNNSNDTPKNVLHPNVLHPRTNNVDKNSNPLISLQHPPMPPVLQPVKESSRSETKAERAERRQRRREEEGHRSKRKSSRSSSKRDRRSSKRERRSDGRRRKDREEGEMHDSDEEPVYDASGMLLTGNSRDEEREKEMNVNNAPPQFRSDLPPSQENIRPPDDKPYQAVPPSWDLNVPSMSSYGYGSSSDLVKQGQNSLYERYYEMIKQGYEAKERERNTQAVNVPRGNVGLDGNTSYLPPPPIPQGILGESLFNQGKLENLHNLDGNQGNLPDKQFLLPPPTTLLGPAFVSRPAPQPEMSSMDATQRAVVPPQLPAPPIGSNVVDPIGLMLPLGPPPINPALLQTKPPNFSRGLLELPTKIGITDLLPSVAGVPQNQMSLPQRNAGVGALLNNFPNTKQMERERENRVSREGRGRDRNRSHQNFGSQQTLDTSRHAPMMSMSLSRDLLPDSGKGTMFNVPDWLVNEGGELRLSESANGESFIRYWPRYMNEDGHATLFHSLRKSVKWYQRRQLVGLPSDDNWINLPKLVSWIGPCNYEKDGMILDTNTSWPPEVVDLLHRLIHFSNSSFNSCLMSLYCSGHSHHPWHSEAHEAMAKNPTTACISLGVTRTLEMKRVDGPESLRFPLFPGSLFVMEGATHSDWMCQIPKEPQIKGERISLSFRTMLMIKGITV